MYKWLFVIILGSCSSFLVVPLTTYSFENKVMVVTTDSMLPTLKPNDLIIVRENDITNTNIGDIVVFESHIEDIDVVAHRVVDYSLYNGKIGIKTKGDNVSEVDSWIVFQEDFIGKVINIIPGIGIFFIAPVRYTLTAVIIVISILLFIDIVSDKKRK